LANPAHAIRINKTGPVPIHDQIKDQIVGLIHAGRLKPGEQLPTIRALSIELAVNFNTVAHAYHELHAEGVISTRRGEGTFVAEAQVSDRDRRRLRERKLAALVKGLLDEAERLGYSPAEVEQAVRERLAAPAQEK
jgi:GntR family transcriptional regulator